jgi:hypothetical protein
MNTFKFNTEDTKRGREDKFVFPPELAEEDRFLAEILAEIAPCVRTLQATEGKLSEERRTKIVSNIKKVLEEEKN